MKELGGYFKRYRGGSLAPWLEKSSSGELPAEVRLADPSPELDLETRATLAFLEVSIRCNERLASFLTRTQADKLVNEGDEAMSCGATASIALIQSFDSPATPFYASQQIGLTVPHCG